MSDEMLTAGEVARLLGDAWGATIQPDTIGSYRRRGLLPAAEWVTPSLPRYRQADVEALAANRPRDGRPAELDAVIRLATEERKGRASPDLRLFIARDVWLAIGAPARIDIRRAGGRPTIVAVEGDAGWALTGLARTPRAYVNGARDLLRLEDGHYRAVARGGEIVVGERVEGG